MGMYVNPSAEGFERILNGGLYVDKTGLIAYTNAVMNTASRLVCFSRPRRFGKTFAAQMLVAYYSKGADSRRLFEHLKVTEVPEDRFPLRRVPPFERYLNQCDVLFWDMTRFVVNPQGVDRAVDLLRAELIRDLHAEFPQVQVPQAGSVSDMLLAVHLATGRQFYIVIDEWDALFREARANEAIQRRYIDFLRDLFKDAQSARAICGAYMTGILPIRKYGTQSALTDFSEFTMVSPGVLAEFVGFTEAEAQDVCRKGGLDFDAARRWYDGYRFDRVGHVYSPNSVMQAAYAGRFAGYWTQTETYESLRLYLELNIDGLKDDVIAMLGGGRCRIDAGSFSNDLRCVDNRDKVLTLLVHLGYLAYDADRQEVCIPNEEIREEFIRTFRNGSRSELVKAVELSDAILRTTIEGDEDHLAELIGRIHLAQTSPHFYANEQALRTVILMAYLSATDHYARFEEIGAGRGYADIVFLPVAGSRKPALLLELKKGVSAEAAVSQIRSRNYVEVLERFRYHGPALLVGISFEPESNRHRCRIEKVTVA